MTPVREKTVGQSRRRRDEDDRGRAAENRAAAPSTSRPDRRGAARATWPWATPIPSPAAPASTSWSRCWRTSPMASEAKMLSPEVVSAFEAFQNGVPFVALTTIQMRESVRNDGSLDAFVMEYQTFAQRPGAADRAMCSCPSAMRHDNPLYAVGNLPPGKHGGAGSLRRIREQPRPTRPGGRSTASIRHSNYQAPYALPDGETCVRGAAALEEQEGRRPAGRRRVPVRCQRLDGGAALQGVRNALTKARDFISPENSIGLVVLLRPGVNTAADPPVRPQSRRARSWPRPRACATAAAPPCMTASRWRCRCWPRSERKRPEHQADAVRADRRRDQRGPRSSTIMKAIDRGHGDPGLHHRLRGRHRRAEAALRAGRGRQHQCRRERRSATRSARCSTRRCNRMDCSDACGLS